MPENWKHGRGKFNATISTSPWLPKIAGVPVILDYPHGCFEQISTKLLGYSFLANLVAYLPDIDAREAEYRRMLERGMKQFNDSLFADGMLPYWPGGDTANNFVTCQAFWAVNESVNAGFEAPEGLRDKLAGALKKIVNGQTASNAFEKCFALFVLTQYETGRRFQIDRARIRICVATRPAMKAARCWRSCSIGSTSCRARKSNCCAKSTRRSKNAHSIRDAWFNDARRSNLRARLRHDCAKNLD